MTLFAGIRDAWRLSSSNLGIWNRNSWWPHLKRHHWWLRLLRRQPKKPTSHAPWLNAEAVAYRKSLCRDEPFLG